jgi:peptide-methionine (S)-S-oxide reductase
MTEMTKKLSIITGCGAGATESFVVEDYHQKYLFKNFSGYQCPTHRLHC